MLNFRKTGMALAWPLITTSIILLFILPAFFHCLDFGHLNIDATDLKDSKDYTSKNISVSGFPLVNNYLSLETTNLRSRVSSYSYYLPVVPKGWKQGDELKCIMQLKGNELDELSRQDKELAKQNSPAPLVFDAVVRNTLWEGIDNDIIQEFKKNFKISPDVVFIEYGTKASYPWWVAGFVFLISLLGSYKILTDQDHIYLNTLMSSSDDLKERGFYEKENRLYFRYKNNKMDIAISTIKLARVTDTMFCVIELHLANKTKIIIDCKSAENKEFFNQLLVKFNKAPINWNLSFPKTKTIHDGIINGYEITMS